MPNETQILKSIFDSNNIPVSTEWLSECINWCKSEVLTPNYTLDQLKNAIHDQWLNLDLRDIETAILPPSLSEKKFMVLNGNFSLQVMKVVDISKPKYWQLQKIRKENVLTRPTGNEERDTIGSGKRVLQLTLTDGVQYVEAMEYKPIQLLNINLTPGIKIRLSGPITIRRGRLMLQEQTIRILGGEVEGLLVSNAAENILAAALNLPLNNNPNSIDAKLLTVEAESENVDRNIPKEKKIVPLSRDPKISSSVGTINKEKNQNNYSIATTLRQDDFPTEEDMELMLIAENQLGNRSVPKISINKNLPTDEELELLMEIEENEKNRNTFNKTPDLFEDDFDADQIDRLIAVNEGDNEKKETNESRQVISISDIQPNKRDSNKEFPTEPEVKKRLLEVGNPDSSLFEDFVNEDLFADLDLDNLGNQVNPKSDIIDLLELKRKIGAGCFGSYKVKAKFKSIEKKVTVQGDEFKAEMRIEDLSCDFVCKVHSDVISKWAGLTPVEMLSLRKNILSGKVEFKNKVQSILQEIMKKILAVDNVMEIQLVRDNPLPVIKEIFY